MTTNNANDAEAKVPEGDDVQVEDSAESVEEELEREVEGDADAEPEDDSREPSGLVEQLSRIRAADVTVGLGTEKSAGLPAAIVFWVVAT